MWTFGTHSFPDCLLNRSSSARLELLPCTSVPAQTELNQNKICWEWDTIPFIPCPSTQPVPRIWLMKQPFNAFLASPRSRLEKQRSEPPPQHPGWGGYKTETYHFRVTDPIFRDMFPYSWDHGSRTYFVVGPRTYEFQSPSAAPNPTPLR